MFDRDALVWSSGGLAVGCMIGVCVTRALNVFLWSPDKKDSNSIHEMNAAILKNNSSVDNSMKFTDQATTYSQMTMMMGTPTATSSFLDAQEYQQYPASSAYPELRGNR